MLNFKSFIIGGRITTIDPTAKTITVTTRCKFDDVPATEAWVISVTDAMLAHLARIKEATPDALISCYPHVTDNTIYLDAIRLDVAGGRSPQ